MDILDNKTLSKMEGRAMNISEFIGNYKIHPILFIGSGFSQRYLSNSFTWSGLLEHLAEVAYGDKKKYLDLMYKYPSNFEIIGQIIEEHFDNNAEDIQYDVADIVNDLFYQNLKIKNPTSRLKLYIAHRLGELQYRQSDLIKQEIAVLKQARKNISSIITTNYDTLVEEVFQFDALVGNHILLSNPYGSVYKIHGCVKSPENIILTTNDYSQFHQRYELIKAQLLSLFIHNPIIFIGYSISDENIKLLLKTIFTYVQPNSEQAEKIRKNFLLIEWAENSDSDMVFEYDLNLDSKIISINKIKTDNYIRIYEAIAKLNLPVSALDIRKVQNVFKDIVSGGSIKVLITENIDDLSNKDKVLAIGSNKTIRYEFKTISELISSYFSVMEEGNHQLIKLIDNQSTNKDQFIPIFGFSKICPNLDKAQSFKISVYQKLCVCSDKTPERNNSIKQYKHISEILNSNEIARTYKLDYIFRGVWHDILDLEEVKNYLINYSDDRNDSNYKRILCAYDYKVYGNESNNNTDTNSLNLSIASI